MENKFLTIFLGAIISLLFANYCFAALSNPITPGVESVGTGSAILTWDYNTKELIDVVRFKLLWRDTAAETWYDVYPKTPTSTSTEAITSVLYVLRGLPTGGSTYEWTIGAENINPTLNSDDVIGTPFETTVPEEEEPGEEEGEENGGPSTISEIMNPFGEDLGNVQDAANAFMEFLLLAGFAVGPILIIYAAFLLLTKQGSPVAVAQAQKIILWTVISLSIMLFAKGVPSVVKDLFK